MARLRIPNAIANGQVADGNALQENFRSIQDWANGNIGNGNMSREPAERITIDRMDADMVPLFRDIYAWYGAAEDTHMKHANLTQFTWYSIGGFTAQQSMEAWFYHSYLVSDVGTWQVQLLVGGVAYGENTVGASTSEKTQISANPVQVASGDTVVYQIRRTTADPADTLGIGRIEVEFHLRPQAE